MNSKKGLFEIGKFLIVGLFLLLILFISEKVYASECTGQSRLWGYIYEGTKNNPGNMVTHGNINAAGHDINIREDGSYQQNFSCGSSTIISKDYNPDVDGWGVLVTVPYRGGGIRDYVVENDRYAFYFNKEYIRMDCYQDGCWVVSHESPPWIEIAECETYNLEIVSTDGDSWSTPGKKKTLQAILKNQYGDVVTIRNAIEWEFVVSDDEGKVVATGDEVNNYFRKIFLGPYSNAIEIEPINETAKGYNILSRANLIFQDNNCGVSSIGIAKNDVLKKYGMKAIDDLQIVKEDFLKINNFINLLPSKVYASNDFCNQGTIIGQDYLLYRGSELVTDKNECINGHSRQESGCKLPFGSDGWYGNYFTDQWYPRIRSIQLKGSNIADMGSHYLIYLDQWYEDMFLEWVLDADINNMSLQKYSGFEVLYGFRTTEYCIRNPESSRCDDIARSAELYRDCVAGGKVDYDPCQLTTSDNPNFSKACFSPSSREIKITKEMIYDSKTVPPNDVPFTDNDRIGIVEMFGQAVADSTFLRHHVVGYTKPIKFVGPSSYDIEYIYNVNVSGEHVLSVVNPVLKIYENMRFDKCYDNNDPSTSEGEMIIYNDAGIYVSQMDARWLNNNSNIEIIGAQSGGLLAINIPGKYGVDANYKKFNVKIDDNYLNMIKPVSVKTIEIANIKIGGYSSFTGSGAIDSPVEIPIMVNFIQCEESLTARCSASPSSGRIGDNISWKAELSGQCPEGVLPVYTWRENSNTECSGNGLNAQQGKEISKSYNETGPKRGYVEISCGDQVYESRCCSANISDQIEPTIDFRGVFISKKIVDSTGDRDITIRQDWHVVNNSPPGFSDLFAPLWRELVP
jgi:hypothetical protein